MRWCQFSLARLGEIDRDQLRCASARETSASRLSTRIEWPLQTHLPAPGCAGSVRHGAVAARADGKASQQDGRP